MKNGLKDKHKGVEGGSNILFLPEGLDMYLSTGLMFYANVKKKWFI